MPALWVVDVDKPAILRIGLETGQIENELTGVRSEAPAGFAVGDGYLWTLSVKRREVLRIDPETGRAVTFLRTPGDAGRHLAVEGDDVWVAGSSTKGTVIRAANTSGEIEASVDTGARIDGLVAAFGAGWAAQPSQRRVVRVDPSGAVAAYVPVPHSVGRLAAGEGAVWVLGTDDAGAGALSKIDPAQNAVVATVPVSGGDGWLAAGSGFVWVTDASESLITRVSPADPAQRAEFRTVLRPEQVAAGQGAVWVVTRFGLSIVRVDVETVEIIGAVNPDAVLEFPVIG